MDLSELRYRSGKELDDYETAPTIKLAKENALSRIEENKVRMALLQDKLYAEGKTPFFSSCRGWTLPARTARSSMF